jgi:hypothetical protein
MKEHDKETIDNVIEVVSTSEVKSSDFVAFAKILLQTIGGVQGEPNFNEAAHVYALSRLAEAGPSERAYEAVFAD